MIGYDSHVTQDEQTAASRGKEILYVSLMKSRDILHIQTFENAWMSRECTNSMLLLNKNRS